MPALADVGPHRQPSDPAEAALTARTARHRPGQRTSGSPLPTDAAHRRCAPPEEETEDKGYLRGELHYGSSPTLPEGVTDSDIKAACKDGIRDIRVPVPSQPPRAHRSGTH
ncbi:MAG: Hsp20 family protein [Pseudonocardiaceae bacterium]